MLTIDSNAKSDQMKKNHFLTLTGILLLVTTMFNLTGCGLTQIVSDGTSNVAKSIFYKQIKVVHLDFTARDALNTDDNGLPLSTIVRIYQLKNIDNFNYSDYSTLFANDNEALKSELVAQKDIRIRPGESISVDMPMEEDTKFVAIAAMFHTPDLITNDWRVVIPKKQLLPETPRHLVLTEHKITLSPIEGLK